ncbi:sugar O-acetyltransferase [Spiroplasma sp. BIUS-1]|uniref:sugar O-acetyltransferase n=1 Tax=Spiroplasma sp. BIUS-1 TaxID=216964 RepID=UPI0013A6BBA1|nr:sugar O-acetyltransferase [Spiroplasma sp. BIUS-1]
MEWIKPTDDGAENIIKAIFKTQKKLKKINYANISTKRRNKLFSKLSNYELGKDFMFLTPINIDLGLNLKIGNNVFINFGCTFLDRGGISIGDNTMIGPNCSFYTSNHPLDPEKRRHIISKPIVIENDVWFGGNVIVLPGVTIGANSTIGAGSIIRKDVPKNSLVIGDEIKPLVIKK